MIGLIIVEILGYITGFLLSWIIIFILVDKYL